MRLDTARSGAPVEVVARIEFLITQELEGAAVEGVAPGPGNDVHRGPGGGAEFRREGVLVYAELLNALGVHPGDAVLASSVRDGDGLGVHAAGVHAVH